MSYLLDTDWLIDALGGKRGADVTLRRLAPQGIAVCWVSVGEVYDVAFDSPNPQAHLANFRGFLEPFRRLGLTDSIMERFAETRAFLRRRGEIIPDFDILIAATALDLDLTLLTRNREHFDRIPDLRLYQPR